MKPNKRHVFVTGASRGLGHSMAQALAQDGYTVFAGLRSAADFEQMASTSPNIVPVYLDVTDDTQIAAAVQTVSNTTDVLDALVNSAGVYIPAPFEQIGAADMIETFRVNVFGVVAVTQAFLPLIRRGRGRIVLISSVNGRLSLPGVSAYSASKFALTAFADAMRLELEPWGIFTILIEPGALATDIRVRGFEKWEARHRALPAKERQLYAPLLTKWKSMLESMEATAGSPDYAVSAVREALNSSSPRTRYVAAPNEEQMLALMALPDEERDDVFRGMLGAG